MHTAPAAVSSRRPGVILFSAAFLEKALQENAAACFVPKLIIAMKPVISCTMVRTQFAQKLPAAGLYCAFVLIMPQSASLSTALR